MTERPILNFVTMVDTHLSIVGNLYNEEVASRFPELLSITATWQRGSVEQRSASLHYLRALREESSHR
jgi:hypothetical protein